MLILTIETSCDETAAAVVRDGRLVLSSVISSQVATHAEYGGVVPEIASRKHLEMITPVVRQALDEAGVMLAEIEGIAVTRGPGLLGALLVGVSMAKSLALACRIPLVGVHHIEGHLLAGFLEQPVLFPFLALVVSGGHTHLYRVDGIGRYRILGRTIDDAVGEAYDKTATLLGLGYPGGALIDKLAQQGSPTAVKFPRPLLHDKTLNFSFSGLKTAVLTHLKKQSHTPEGAELHDLCASFQAAVCEVLVKKTEAALKQEGLQRLVVGGGVACNSGLRHAMQQLATRLKIELQIPPPVLCGDNAAMLAVAGDAYLTAGCLDDLAMDAIATWPLDQVARWEQLP
ncbi:O-sialoglycoprotein endopeptidase [Trichlorobacter thiogenes]|uniref:tRNA N6-adenosine threonylcarbamoyltransferase n=1 Tax=Trichlorobacter thiogenes TaxID=115783 RepID=A0A1T4QW02_9BACT|nr:tRNA (adenosine(37)-N6)-threonylcarbamoyltransferase complex transferase subunit TsaD [Trichlorobacter thiogenes]SKA07913.1 O-sialoglycoprotein endopeptidase [Trichlorobacter thiogenes]